MVWKPGAYLFEPELGWERVPDMSFGRWYPSVICLPDGRMMVVSGEGADGARTQQVEVFDIQSRQWEVLPESANRMLPLFPRLHVLPSGAVACAGEGNSKSRHNGVDRISPGTGPSTTRCREYAATLRTVARTHWTVQARAPGGQFGRTAV